MAVTPSLSTRSVARPLPAAKASIASLFRHSCISTPRLLALEFSSRSPTLTLNTQIRPRSAARSGSMASLSSATSTAQEDSLATVPKDLLVIGPGVLGKFVAGLWMKEFPGCSVAGETVTTNHHAELQSLGIKPLLKDDHNHERFPFVIFCAPPSGSSDYVGELRLAAQQWNGEGVFLFTSSSAVYDCMDNGDCDEVKGCI